MTRSQSRHILLLFLGVLLFNQTATILSAGTITLDFDDLPDSEILTNQYPGLTFGNAIVLTSGISLNEFEFPPRSGANVISDNGGPITITFGSPVLSVSGYFTYLASVTILAFDGANNQVAAATSLSSSNMALSGEAGSAPNEFIAVKHDPGIYSVTISGDPVGSSFVLDNAILVTKEVPTPESSSWLLLCIGALAMIALKQVTRLRPMINKPKLAALLVVPLLLVGTGVLLAQPTSKSIGSSVYRSTQPVMGQAAAVPATFVANQSMKVSITVPVVGSVISSGVNLLRLSGPGQPAQILGQLRDDGQGGDAVAGDSIYSIRLALSQPGEKVIQLQISAAVRGALYRLLSAPFNLLPIGPNPALPPDPGPSGTTTLAGVDSDADGIRDDVQRYVAAYGTSAKVRAAMTQLVKSYQNSLVDGGNQALASLDLLALGYAIDCLYIVAPRNANQIRRDLEAKLLNTRERISAYLASQGAGLPGNAFRLPTAETRGARCLFDPVTFPN